MMIKSERNELYRNAYSLWGKEKQFNMLMEECAELIQACNKELRFENTASMRGLVNELADVEIMVEQIKHMEFMDDAVAMVKSQKLQRLKQVLKKQEEKSK